MNKLYQKLDVVPFILLSDLLGKYFWENPPTPIPAKGGCENVVTAFLGHNVWSKFVCKIQAPNFGQTESELPMD